MIRQRCHSSPRGGTGGGEGVWWRDDNYNDYNNYDGHVNGDGQEQRRGYIRRQGTQTHERFYGGGWGGERTTTNAIRLPMKTISDMSPMICRSGKKIVIEH